MTLTKDMKNITTLKEKKYCNEQQEHNYGEDQAEEGDQYHAETGEQEAEQAADAHWLDEFGI